MTTEDPGTTTSDRPQPDPERRGGLAPAREPHPMAGHVTVGADAGGADGVATVVNDVRGVSSPRGERPGASAVLDVPTAKVVAFEFDAGGELHDHAACHPVIIRVERGAAELTLPDRVVTLRPGALVHLPPMLRHAVRALEPTTLTVTMLLPHG